MATKLRKITITNLKAIASFEGTFNGCTVILTGANRIGKSSIFKSLPERCRGIKPAVILKENEVEGGIEWELESGEKLIWKFNSKTKVGESLVYITEKDIKTELTKTIMNKFFPATFDLDKFLHETPKEQVKIIQKIIGVDFTEVDSEYKVAFDDRTLENRKRDDAKVLLKPIDTKLPKELITAELEEVEKEILGFDAHNQKFDNVKQQTANKQQQVTRNNDEVAKHQKEIKRLEGLINGINKDTTKLQTEVKNGEAWMLEDKHKRKDDDASFALATKKQEMVDKNIKISNNNKAIKAKEDYDALVKSADAKDAEVKRIEIKKRDMIKEAKLPVGFDFGVDGITYNGLEFSKEQLSSSEIYIAALQLACMNMGEVRTQYFDASLLDKKSLKEIEVWANKNDLQLLIEMVDREGGEIHYELVEDIK